MRKILYNFVVQLIVEACDVYSAWTFVALKMKSGEKTKKARIRKVRKDGKGGFPKECTIFFLVVKAMFVKKRHFPCKKEKRLN